MNPRRKQSLQYSFPYHYIPLLTPGFSQTISWPWGLNYAAGLKLILSYLKKLAFTRLIDIGTGDGRLVREISLMFPGKNIAGTDYYIPALNLASALNPSLVYFPSDLTQKPLPIIYDAATIIEVLEHIPVEKLNKFLINLSRSLKSNAFVLLTVPHSNLPRQEKHFQHFTSESLTDYLSARFEIHEILFLSRQDHEYQLILGMLQNNFFSLTNPRLNQLLFNYYWKHLFFTDEKHCSRVFMLLRCK